MKAQEIAEVYRDRRTRYAERDTRGGRVRDILANRIDLHFKDIVSPGEEPVVANLVWAAARVTAQRVGKMPRLEGRSSANRESEREKARVEKHEHQIRHASEVMNLPKTLLQAAYWLVTHDMAAFVVRPSSHLKVPVIEVKDPLTAYPGTVYPSRPEVVDCLFANRMPAYQAKYLYDGIAKALSSQEEEAKEVVIGEFWDDKGVSIAMVEPVSMDLAYIPSPTPGEPLVFIGRGFSPDLDFHGQFDHVIPTMIAQAKLFALMMNYAEQQVFAETILVGDLASNDGEWAYGPGAVNQLRAEPGAQAAKLTNNMSPQVFQQIDVLERFIRLGGNFPAQLSGEPVATIATGRGVEALNVTVDDNVNYWQSVLSDVVGKALRAVAKQSVAIKASGYQNYANDVDVFARYLSGQDPADVVRKLQLQGAKNISRRSVMNSLPDFADPLSEELQIDKEELRDAMLQSILAEVAQGTMKADAVAEILKRRDDGESLADAVKAVEVEEPATPNIAEMLLGGGLPPGGPEGALPPGGPEGALPPEGEISG